MGKYKITEDGEYLEGYKLLANAIIQQACEDYEYCIITEGQFKRFCFGDWFSMLTNVDGEYIYKKVTSLPRKKRAWQYESKRVKDRDKETDRRGKYSYS